MQSLPYKFIVGIQTGAKKTKQLPKNIQLQAKKYQDYYKVGVKTREEILATNILSRLKAVRFSHLQNQTEAHQIVSSRVQW